MMILLKLYKILKWKNIFKSNKKMYMLKIVMKITSSRHLLNNKLQITY